MAPLAIFTNTRYANQYTSFASTLSDYDARLLHSYASLFLRTTWFYILGTTLTYLATGILLAQLYCFWVTSNKRQDRRIHLLILAITCNNVALIALTMWGSFSVVNDNINRLSWNHTASWHGILAFTPAAISVSLSQTYYISKFVRFTGHSWLGYVCYALACATAIMGLSQTIIAATTAAIDSRGTLRGITVVQMTLWTIMTVALCSNMCWALHCRFKVAIPKTAKVIKSFYGWTIASGFILSGLALLTIFLIVVHPGAAFFVAVTPSFPLIAQVTLMAVINNRDRWLLNLNKTIAFEGDRQHQSLDRKSYPIKPIKPPTYRQSILHSTISKYSDQGVSMPGSILSAEYQDIPFGAYDVYDGSTPSDSTAFSAFRKSYGMQRSPSAMESLLEDRESEKGDMGVEFDQWKRAESAYCRTSSLLAQVYYETE